MSKIDIDKINGNNEDKINLIKSLINNDDVIIKRITITPKEKMENSDIDEILNVICNELDNELDKQKDKQESLSKIEYSDIVVSLMYLLDIINAKFISVDTAINQCSVSNTILNNYLTEAIKILKVLDNKKN